VGEVEVMITKDMTVGEVLARSPQTVQVFLSYGLDCVYCPAAQRESIEEVAEAHGIDVEELLSQLNRFALH
jgi:hybrid cluster-associated redox disulfide protein